MGICTCLTNTKLNNPKVEFAWADLTNTININDNQIRKVPTGKYKNYGNSRTINFLKIKTIKQENMLERMSTEKMLEHRRVYEVYQRYASDIIGNSACKSETKHNHNTTIANNKEVIQYLGCEKNKLEKIKTRATQMNATTIWGNNKSPTQTMLEYQEINDNNNSWECQYSHRQIANEEEIKYLKNIKKHLWFMNFTEEILNNLLDEAEGIQLEKDAVIYEEGDDGNNLFIIKTGSVEVTSASHKSKVFLYAGDCFGEWALIQSSVKRTETAKVISEKIEVWSIDGDSFRNVNMNCQENSVEEILYFFNGSLQLSSLDPCTKYRIALQAKIEEFQAWDWVTSNNWHQDNIYLVKSGRWCYKNSKTEMTRTIYSKDYFIFDHLFYGCNEDFNYNNQSYEVTALEKTCCYVVSTQSIVNVLGGKYKSIILRNIFSQSIQANHFFKVIFLKTHEEEIFTVFKVKQYSYDEVVYPTQSSKNKKAIIIWKGTLSLPTEDIHQSGMIYGDEIINSYENLQAPLKVTSESWIVLEASWQDIRDILRKLSKSNTDYLNVFKRANRLSKTAMFRYWPESRLLEWSSQLMVSKEFRASEVIIKKGEIINTFYLIDKGRAKILDNNNQLIREIDEGNGFGEVSLLNNDTHSIYTVKAITEVSCYTIEKNIFIQYLIDEKINNYFRKKIYWEDDNISLDSLYMISKLGKGKYGQVDLVHNDYYLYAIKAVPLSFTRKDTILGKYLWSEKIILQKIDHPFIMKLVKTWKKESVCFFWMEYINGESLDEFVAEKRKKSSKWIATVQQIKLYVASFFLVWDYWNKKWICHRDWKPSNVWIDSQGYWKIIDFGAAHIIKDFTYSVLGTPQTIAPEILIGKGYSFPCDYWSVGIVLYYIYYGEYPFNSDVNVLDLYKEIVKGVVNYPKEGSVEVEQFLRKLLNHSPFGETDFMKGNTTRFVLIKLPLARLKRLENCKYALSPGNKRKKESAEYFTSFRKSYLEYWYTNNISNAGNCKNQTILSKTKIMMNWEDKKEIDTSSGMFPVLNDWFDEF